MSNYSNGQPYQPYYSYGSQGQPNQYNQQGPTSDDLRRSSSFNAGDDARFLDQSQQQQQTPYGYAGYGGSPPPQSQPTFGSGTNDHGTWGNRAATQSTLGGYQHQNQLSTPTHSTYNPAQYQTQPQYNPQAYGSSPQSSTASAYQPYVPAAYHDSSVNRTASVHGNYYAAGPPVGHGHLPPAPPVRSNTFYGGQEASYGYQHEPPSAQSPAYSTSFGSPVPYPPYSPSLAPPPPPPHHDYQGNLQPYSHTTGGYQDQGAPAQHGYTHGARPPGLPSPDINRQHSSASQVSNASGPFVPSPQPSGSTPPSRNPSQSSPQRRDTLDRHPQGRLLPGLPAESDSEQEYLPPTRAFSGLDDLVGQVNAAIGNAGGASHRHPASRSADALFPSDSPQLGMSPDERPTHLNGVVTTGEHAINYAAFAHDSDAEAAAGLAAMQAADEQEAAEEARRHSIHAYGQGSDPRLSDRERSDESDYGTYDLSLAGGGHAGTMHYGDDEVGLVPSRTESQPERLDRLNPRMSSVRSSAVSSEGRASQVSVVETTQSSDSAPLVPPYPAEIARVDAGGTGGLTEPRPHPRRLSYEDGDEVDLLDIRDSIPDLFFHPGMNPQRPLPPTPSISDPGSRSLSVRSTGTFAGQNRLSAYDGMSHLPPGTRDALQPDALGPAPVPRSTSLASSRSTPRPDQPMRSKTDADRARLLRQQQSGRPFNDIYEVNSPRTDVGTLDLPAIPRKKFDPSKISVEQFRRCSEPWALSSILSWIRGLAEEETDLKENTISEAVVALFTHKVPTMNTIEAESLVEKIIRDMLFEGVLIKDEEWVKFGPASMTGVLYQLTGTGCYSPRLHLQPAKGRCYSHHCMRTLKKVDLSLPSAKKETLWHEHYKLRKEDLQSRDKKEVERQNVLHEIVTGEETFIDSLDVVRILYRDQLTAAQPPVVSAKRMQSFLRDVFGVVDKVKKVNEDFLLAQLKYRQNEQGPWITGFSDIFREWIRRARAVYVEYAAAYPRADMLVRDEDKRNVLFHQLLERARQDPRSNRLSWDSYLKAPIQRLQRYILLLESVLKLMKQESEEKTNLAYAVDEIKAAAHEADAKVNENNKKVELAGLSRKIILRKPMEREVDLALDHLGRTVMLRGDLQRLGGKGINWVDTHAILFDHYLVLAKTVVPRDTNGTQRQEMYDVSKTPIPMDLIVLESTNDPAIVKSTMRGIAVTTTVAPRGQPSPDPRLGRTTSGVSGGALVHTNTSMSANSGGSGQTMVTNTTLEPNSRDDKILYPFKVKHLGKTEVYTLYAATADKRQEWCEAIVSAKTQHAEALFAQNAEPFRLRVLADTAFGVSEYSGVLKRVVIKGTPLDRGVQDVERRFEGQGRPAPVCRASVNCATVFHQPYGRLMCAVGTDNGVYVSEYQNPRGWIRSIQMKNVTQIAVIEEFNLFILISDKILIAYHLDVVCPPSGPPVPQTDATIRKAPQRLSGSRDVGFFVAGKMKDRALVFYKKREGINSIFKILEPVLQKSTTSRSRWLGTSNKRGQTDFFREYDEFYIPTETYGLNLFHSSLAVSTARGVEVLTLDKKNPWAVPNLRSETPDMQAHLSTIASRIKDLKPLGMFRLSEPEFLVAFEECAVYVNKHGDISRGVVMEFVGRANSACLYGPYLILFNDDFVEIRDAQNGRLKQVIAGKDVRMLDDGGNLMPGSAPQNAALGGGMNGLGVQGHGSAPKTVKICMQHPEYDKSYVIVELLPAAERT